MIYDQVRVNGGNNFEYPEQRWVPKLVINQKHNFNNIRGSEYYPSLNDSLPPALKKIIQQKLKIILKSLQDDVPLIPKSPFLKMNSPA